MMRSLLACLLLVVLTSSAPPDVAFEADGIRVAGDLVQAPVLKIRETASGSVLVSGTVIEPVGSVLMVTVAAGRTLKLEPGVRALRSPSGVILSTHGKRRIRFEADGIPMSMTSPVTVKPGGEGWDFGGGIIVGSPLLAARLQGQDEEEDQDLDAMGEAARALLDALRKLREGRREEDLPSWLVDMKVPRPDEPKPRRKAVVGEKKKKLQLRRVLEEDPAVAFRPLPFLSEAGF